MTMSPRGVSARQIVSPVGPWQAVVVAAQGGRFARSLYVAGGAAPIGELQHTDAGEWAVRRYDHRDTSARHSTAREALAAMGLLRAIRAADLIAPAGTPGALPGGPIGARVVLSDGTAAVVRGAAPHREPLRHLVRRETPAGGLLTIVVEVLPESMVMAHPCGLQLMQAWAVRSGAGPAMYGLTLPAVAAALAVAPPCVDDTDAPV